MGYNRPMRKLAIAISKGGTGKTTVAVNLAAGLALAGARVLLVDMDDQGQASLMLGVDPAERISDLARGEVKFKRAVVEARERLGLLAGGPPSEKLRRFIRRKDFTEEKTLAGILQPAEGKFDFVLLDTGPAWDVLAINALYYAREILCPVNMEVLALRGLEQFCGRVEQIRKDRPELELRYVLPTFADGRVRKTAEILQQLQARFPGRLCPPVRYCSKLSEAPGEGQTIFEFAPASSGARDFVQLTERIVRG